MAKWDETIFRKLCRLGACIIRDKDEPIWFYGDMHDRLISYADANFGRTSRGCQITTLHGGPISWSCKRLTAKYLSSTLKVELKMACHAGEILEGEQNLYAELPGSNRKAIPLLWGDQKGAVQTVNRPGTYAEMSKHLAKDAQALRGRIAELTLLYMWISTQDMLADIGTKWVSRLSTKGSNLVLWEYEKYKSENEDR